MRYELVMDGDVVVATVETITRRLGAFAPGALVENALHGVKQRGVDVNSGHGGDPVAERVARCFGAMIAAVSATKAGAIDRAALTRALIAAGKSAAKAATAVAAWSEAECAAIAATDTIRPHYGAATGSRPVDAAGLLADLD